MKQFSNATTCGGGPLFCHSFTGHRVSSVEDDASTPAWHGNGFRLPVFSASLLPGEPVNGNIFNVNQTVWR